MSRRIPAWLAAATLLLAGCSAYRLGSGSTETRTIEVRQVRNATALPGIHAAMHQALVATLSADSRLRVRDGGEPLETEAVAVERIAITQSPDEALIAGQLRVTLSVRCTLRSADGKSVRFADRPFSASAIVSASGDLGAAERNALPRLTSEIAAQVRDAAIGSW